MAKATRKTSPATVIEKHAAWACGRLKKYKSVSLDDYRKYRNRASKKPDDDGVRTEWSKIIRVLYIALKELGVGGTSLKGGTLSCANFEQNRYVTPGFRPDENVENKDHIGKLVAHYLKNIEPARSCFLGSGSTIFRTGIQMIPMGPYTQLFWTVNIPLVAAWSEELGRSGKTPVGKITIPEGEFETESFRFGLMEEPAVLSDIGIVVVGADGCRFDPHKQKISLYANSKSVRRNTDLFVKRASHAVVCCLTSDKIKVDPDTGPGPTIEGPPPRYVRRYLVTDNEPITEIATAFEQQRWQIVTKVEDWEKDPPYPIEDEEEES